MSGVSPNGNGPDGVYERLMALLPEAKEDLARFDNQIEEENERHRMAIEAIQEQRREIVRVVKALDPDYAPLARKPRGENKQQSGFGASAARLRKVIEAIEAEGDELFTVLDIYGKLGGRERWGAEPQLYTVFSRLHDMEFVGRAHKAESGRQLYRRLKREVGEQLKREISPEPPKDNLKKAYGNVKIGSGVSVQRAEQIAEAITQIHAQTGQPVSNRQVSNVLQVPPSSQSKIREAMAALVNDGFLKEAGMRRDEGATVASKIYDIADPEAIDRVKARLNAT